MPRDFWAARTDAAPRTGVLLVNLGTPRAPTPTAVRRYLAQFLHDWRVVDVNRWLWCPLLHGIILPLRSRRVARNYAGIWGADGSPLLARSRSLCARLREALPDLDVDLAMTYGEPSVRTVLRAMATRGVRDLLVLPLYPQYSGSTTGAVFDAVTRELQGWRTLPNLRLLRDWHDDRAWIEAIAGRVRAHWQRHGRGERLLLSFHGIPERYAAAGDPYRDQCEAGAASIAAALGLDTTQWALAYQSRFGREPWLQPYTDATLHAWGQAGLGTVDVLCPGFAVDCLETLEEIGKENRAAFIAAGGGDLRYIPALDAGADHVAVLAGLIRRHGHGFLGLERADA